MVEIEEFEFTRVKTQLFWSVLESLPFAPTNGHVEFLHRSVKRSLRGEGNAFYLPEYRRTRKHHGKIFENQGGNFVRGDKALEEWLETEKPFQIELRRPKDYACLLDRLKYIRQHSYVPVSGALVRPTEESRHALNESAVFGYDWSSCMLIVKTGSNKRLIRWAKGLQDAQKVEHIINKHSIYFK